MKTRCAASALLPALLMGLALAACRPQESLPVAGTNPGDTKPPVALNVTSMPVLQVGTPAQLLLDLRAGVALDGVRISLQGDDGLRVTDFAPRLLPAQTPESGSQVFVDVVPGKSGVHRLTAMLELYRGEESVMSLVTLEIPVMASAQPVSAPQAPVEAPELEFPRAADGTVAQ